MSMTSGGPADGPEYLDGSRPAQTPPDNDNKKRLIAVGAIVAGGAVVAGGAWAATSFFSTGAQPAEALPASTVAYFSVDLDPSGGQKIEAIKTLRKFPGFTDKVDLQTDDDLRERFFEEVTSSGECEGLDYDADVKPWLGSRAAMAVVDLGEDEPTPVGVVQTTDSGKAEDGLSALVDACGGGEGAEGDVGGWVVDGDWIVVAETQEIAQKVVDAADGSTLAGNASFEEWTGEAGGDGFMTMYVGKGVTKYLDELGGMGGMGMMGMPGAALGEDGTPSDSEEVPEELQQMIDDFDGMAATVRFDDGAVEIEYAMSNYQPDLTKFIDSQNGADMVAGLPDDTVAAFGMSLEEGWAGAMLDYFKRNLPDESAAIDEQLAQFESETGLAFPEDVETLLGEGVTVSLGSGLDPDAVANGGPGEVPVGIRIDGDADEIQAVLDKIAAQAGPEMAEFMQVTEGDGYAVLALQEGYRGELEGGGSLGDSAAYSEVVESDEAQSVMFVNFNADDDWLVRLTGDSPEVSKNLEPLSAFGVSGWVDDDVLHGLLKLTTD
ncbi:DUF3352 domain-containing protein [Nocardioides cavernae]|uniref:DUF3352 domain-containing protein n=1 Tax=Nocardioides cavernae TaxID=1921566 RepID=A0ABR8NG25_9ACTN|nr:DUF3352 domain-containing protein [Nocardioides cavernae]MBD3927080.1 DUF3352 domain-containing protein [Nocardioides cavernae]MBM7512800.1 hypothetical protein [Nocardioides cavernae]